MTTDQLTLSYDDPRAGRVRKTDPRTSVEAARTCDAQRQRDQILRLLSGELFGLTPDELGDRMEPKVHRGTVASRLAQLRRDQLVEPYGARVNAIGKNVQVWFLRPQPRVVDVRTDLL